METIPRLRYSLSSVSTLHVNELRIALLNWALARSLDGDFVLRVDDLDRGGNSAEKLHRQINALRWLNLDWDEGPDLGGEFGPYRQSQRTKRHEAVAQQLEQNGIALDQATRYLLPTVVDDHDMAITHIVQDAQQTEDASAQLAIYNALAWQPPVRIDIPSVVNHQQQALGNRDRNGGYLLRHFQQAGFLPQALWNYLLLLGWTPKSGAALFTKWTVRKQFQLDTSSASAPIFDWDTLRQLNQQAIQKLSVDQLADQLLDFLEDAYGALPNSNAWLQHLTEAIRSDLVVLDDAVEAAEWAFDMPETTAEAKHYLQASSAKPILARLLAEFATVVLLDDATGHRIVASTQARLQASDQLSADAFQFTLRSALIGRTNGPELDKILGILGKQRTLERIGAALRG
ncbi:MAG: glutamate--tRNA ligase family protein [Candidatus Promineifilaceae bacterium]